ncbi:hypothetical protein QTP88_022924 [Uroleucon formosanum]
MTTFLDRYHDQQTSFSASRSSLWPCSGVYREITATRFKERHLTFIVRSQDRLERALLVFEAQSNVQFISVGKIISQSSGNAKNRPVEIEKKRSGLGSGPSSRF